MSKIDFNKESDEDLVEYYRNSHDLLYIGELYLRYTQLVFGVAMKYLQNEDDAQDATMNVFEKLIIDLKKHNITAFRPWLYMVAKNYCMMEFRKTASERKKQYAFEKSGSEIVESTIELHLDSEEDRQAVLDQMAVGLESLKEDQKKCVQLFYLENKSYKEIADETSYSLNEVKTHIQNGKRNLKLYMNKQNG